MLKTPMLAAKQATSERFLSRKAAATDVAVSQDHDDKILRSHFG